MHVLALTDDVSGGRGRRVVTADSPQAGRLTAGHGNSQEFGGFTFGRPSVNGNQVMAGFSYPTTKTGDQPLSLPGEIPLGDSYRC